MLPQSTLSAALLKVAFLLSILNACVLAQDVSARDVPKPPPSQAPQISFPAIFDGINDVSVRLSRETKLYGWKGCGPDEQKAINEAYRDFHTLAGQSELTRIDWNHQAAKDFWGPEKGDGQVTDENRKAIEGVFQATARMNKNWWSADAASVPGPRSFWIEVRCSGKDGAEDADNVCGDKKSDKMECTKLDGYEGEKPLHSEDRRLYAWSDARGKYGQVMFCNKFFKDLRSLNDAIAEGKKKPKELQNNLESWDNRARVMFHEAAHLTAVTAPRGPSVEDVQIKFKEGDKEVSNYAYGPYYAKLLRNWVQKGKGGLYTRRNADSYAFFALAKYVDKQIQRYPDLPTPGSKKPESDPRVPMAPPIQKKPNGKRSSRLFKREGEDGLLGKKEMEYKDQNIKGFSISGCPGVYSKVLKPKENKGPKITCDDKAPSGLPRAYFISPVNSAASQFCDAVEKERAKKLTWSLATDDPEKQKGKRDLNLTFVWLLKAQIVPKFSLEMNWEPKDASKKCNTGCVEAFEAMFSQNCDAAKPGLAVSAHVDAECGTYKYKVQKH